MEISATALIDSSDKVQVHTRSVEQATEDIKDPPSTEADTETTAQQKEASVFLGETAQSQSSAWSPWTWLGSSSTPVLAKPGVDNGSQTMTQSKMVEEVALPLDEPVAKCAPEKAPSSTALSSPDNQNPIQSSISTNKSAWSSFFSSKALAMKTITGGENPKDENGMEVMDIDEDDKLDPASSIVSGPSGAKNRLKPELDQGPHSKRPKGSSSSGSGTNTPSSPPAAPLTNSESLKHEIAKADKKGPFSLASSNKSGSNTPPRPPLPNLILPTWEDTFHAPPRSLVPPPPVSKLTKAIKFISGVLFAEDDGGKGKRNVKEFNHFGKALPKAWDTIGENQTPDILRGCRKVVVIGIHGWFPGVLRSQTASKLTSLYSRYSHENGYRRSEFPVVFEFHHASILNAANGHQHQVCEHDGASHRRISREAQSEISENHQNSLGRRRHHPTES
jgi:hypothetical protein